MKLFHMLIFLSIIFFCVSDAVTTNPTGEPSGQPSSVHCGMCLPGEYFADCNKCMSCQSGYFCAGGCNLPQACPVGTYNSNYGSSSSTDCAICPGGYSQPTTASSNCTACPAGHECMNSTASPAPCGKGTYSSGLETMCNVCPEGSYASGEGSLACTVCPAGFACSDKSAGMGLLCYPDASICVFV